MVSFILVGVLRRECHERLLDFGAGTEVIVDGGGITTARVCAGQHSPACPGKLRQPVGDGVTLRDDLAVTQLTDIEIVPVIGCPPHEHICGALNHAAAR